MKILHALDPKCKNINGWKDKEGKPCLSYAKMCMGGNWRVLVKNKLSRFTAVATQGITAFDACCICGKGNGEAVGSDKPRMLVACTRMQICLI